MKLLTIIGLVLTCVIAVSEAHVYGKNGKNIAQKYGSSNYNGLRSGKIGVGHGVGYKIPNNYQGYQGKLGPHQYRFRRYRFGNYRYGRFGQRYGLGYGRYGQNYLRYGYKNGYKGKAYYDEEEQDASRYYPKKYGRYQHGIHGRRFGFGKYRYGRYGQQYGLGYGRYGQNYLRYGYKNGYKGKAYYDEEEQDASRYYPNKYGRYQHGIHGRRFGFGKYRYGRYGQQYGLGYRRYGQNYLRYGYKNGYRRKSYYDEEEQDASRYYPNKYGRYQHGIHGRRFGFGKYRYGRYGQQYGLGYGRYGQNYLRYGYKNGYRRKSYYDEEEQDASRYYPKKYGRYQHGIYGRRFGFGKNRYGRYGQQYGLGYGRYGQNYLRYGYKNGYRRKSYYDEEEQDASRYYPKKYGRYQHGIHGRRFGFGKYRYGRYGQQYGLRYRRYGQNYLRYGYKNGYRRKSYYDEEEQDASRYYPKKYGRYQYGRFGLRYGIGKYSYGKHGRRYGFSKYGYGKYGGRYGSQYGVLGRKYQGYGYGKGKVYYDRQEQD